LTFLHDREEEYEKAYNTGTYNTWLQNLYRVWFQTYAWDLKDNVEPPPGYKASEPSDEAGKSLMEQTIKNKREVSP
jgi:hypothetical protein